MEFQEVRKIVRRVLIEAFALSNDESPMIFQAQTYTVSTLPTAATYPRGIIYVSNETGGATLAMSDGTNWRRMQDRAIVS